MAETMDWMLLGLLPLHFFRQTGMMPTVGMVKRQ